MISPRSLASLASRSLTIVTCTKQRCATQRLSQQFSSTTFTTSPVTDEHKEQSRAVAADLFHQYCETREGVPSLNFDNVRALLEGIGEEHKDDEDALHKIFGVADMDGNGVIDLEEFMEHSDFIVGDNPARIILIVGGPGSGTNEQIITKICPPETQFRI